MPRVYLFTILISLIIGASLERIAAESLAMNKLLITPLELATLILLLSIMYVNEKKAMLEDLLRTKTRRTIGRLIVAGLLALSAYVLLV